MKHGHNYLQYIEGELVNAREHSKKLREMSSIAEENLRKLLPPDETTLTLSVESLGNPEIYTKREEFRVAHSQHYCARSYQAEIENEYFEFPEDFH